METNPINRYLIEGVEYVSGPNSLESKPVTLRWMTYAYSAADAIKQWNVHTGNEFRFKYNLKSVGPFSDDITEGARNLIAAGETVVML